MQSYEFEVKCKNALIKIIEKEYGDKLTVKDLHLVWFAKALGNWKCVIVDLLSNGRIYECTYNGAKEQLYVDVYNKELNFSIPADALTSVVAL